MPGDDHTGSTGSDSRSAVPAAAVVVAVAGLAAALIAAGSTGLLAHPLRHALTWLAMAVAVLAGRPRRDEPPGWLALAVVLGLLMTAVDLPAANVLAVTLVMAALARPKATLGDRVILVAAVATGVLGIFRLAADSIPAVWLAADTVGGMLGWLAGAFSGRPLWLGATFGGVDFLVLSAAVYAGWLRWTAPPRLPRAIYAAAAILLGHFAYLVVLSFSAQLLASLPEVVLPPPSDNSLLGVWAWGNAVRTLLPWNLPALALVIHAAIAAAMFRWAEWLPVVEAAPNRGSQPVTPAGPRWPIGARPAMVVPVVLAAIVPLAVVLGLSRSDLTGKTVVAAQQGFVDWDRPQYDAESAGGYGMLKPLVEGLGGKFVISADLSQEDLAKADVLLLVHPNQNWLARPADSQRVWDFVRGGGSLLVAAEPEIVEGELHSTFNDLLRPTAIRVRRDIAVSQTMDWEHNCTGLAHPAVSGIGDRRNRFGLIAGSSLEVRWPARPLLVGRWALSEPGSDALTTGAIEYDAGERLGDLVLAAQQRIGRGTVVVLGDTSSLHNDVIANSYVFVGRLLGYLAGDHARTLCPQAWWRQLLGLLLAAGLAGLLYWRAGPLRTALVAAVLAVASFGSVACTHHLARVLPGGRPGGPKLACIDAAHLEAYSSDTWNNFGIAGFSRALMRSGYLPLLLPSVSAERLEHAELLISIGPARRFSRTEQQAVRDFVTSGGTFISMAGAEHEAPSRELLDSFGLHVPPSPVPPTQVTLEPEPLGSFRTLYLNTDELQAAMQTYAAWEVTCSEPDYWRMAQWSDGVVNRPFVISRPVGRGTAVAIGDTYLATNQNLESAVNTLPENVNFWRWLITHVTNQDDWVPSSRRDTSGGLPAELPLEAPSGAEPGAGDRASGAADSRASLPEPDAPTPLPGLEPPSPESPAPSPEAPAPAQPPRDEVTP